MFTWCDFQSVPKLALSFQVLSVPILNNSIEVPLDEAQISIYMHIYLALKVSEKSLNGGN